MKRQLGSFLPRASKRLRGVATFTRLDLIPGNWPVPYPVVIRDDFSCIEVARAEIAEQLHTKSDILFEDEFMVAIDKPSGRYVEQVHESMMTELGQHLHLTNRLDRDTSGIVLLLKQRIVYGRVSKQFESHSVEKSYIAMCRPVDEKIAAMAGSEVQLVTGHGRSRFGAWRAYAQEDIGRMLPHGRPVKRMATKLEVGTLKPDGAYLVRCTPTTGRTHQIRLHCALLGMPIVGDVRYGGTQALEGRTLPGHRLHAHVLRLRHPVNTALVEIISPLPYWALNSASTENVLSVHPEGLC